MLYLGVLEFSQDSIIKACFMICVKQWVGVEIRVDVVSSICCWYMQAAASFILQFNH